MQKPIFRPRLDRRTASNISSYWNGVLDAIFVKNGVAARFAEALQLPKETPGTDTPKNGFEIVYLPDNQLKDVSAREETIRRCREDEDRMTFLWPEKLRKFKDVNESAMVDEFKRTLVKQPDSSKKIQKGRSKYY